MLLTTEDLYNQQYDYETLKTNIYLVSLVDILKTQRLTLDFCVKYILNVDFQLTKEEQEITIDMVKKYQPHIVDSDFVTIQAKSTNKMYKKLRIDSFEDFETYLKKHI